MEQPATQLEKSFQPRQLVSQATQYEFIQPETSIEDVPLNPTQPENSILSIGLLGIGLIGMALLLRIIALKLQAEHKQVIDTLKYTDKVPCRNCRFFSNNSYLKCAVHPSDVLKETAIDCSDYCPKNEPPTKKDGRSRS
ncbi:hypothetical protein [Thermocoleostomius sinensis]|jgi:hypothetical protein|uniref:Uncharacterized protein n=1 Tax=Thermocoleostomius sinensis A174 TaxID=2016057 RepID=A0A9E8ZC03_9CYAN|nr:hypothetical protein [Thermocoleostomius sinensis]WAL59144.1 hypothetical protein OXH18_18480 [Thermocoleostomius sinensis A174]